jgi:hypothetical protein
MMGLIEALEDMLAETPPEMTEVTVLWREYHRDANVLPPITDDEPLQSALVSRAIQGDGEHA